MLNPILILLLILFGAALVLSGVLWAGTLFLQGWLYETPTGDLYWRAPAVGVGLAVFYALWLLVDTHTGGHCRSLFEMNCSTSTTYDELRAVVVPKGPEEMYKRIPNVGQGLEYRLNGLRDGKKLTQRPEKIIVKEGGADVVFEPPTDAGGHFKIQQGENLQYYDKKTGRVMVEGDRLGEASQFHWDWLFWNLLFNAIHLGLWFAGLWLVLRFQWAHALGFAVCLWAAITLFPLPMMLDFAEKAFHVV